MELTFSPDNHEYTLDGIVIPSVTQVLKESGLIDTTWYTDGGADRGTKVHQVLHYYDEGDLDLESVDDAIRGYHVAYAKFCCDSGFIPELIEHRVCHQTYRYAGTLDRTGTMNGNKVVLDIKTGQVQPWAALQLAAYAYCFWPVQYQHQRYALEVRPDGTYRLTHYKDPNDIKCFCRSLIISPILGKEVGAEGSRRSGTLPTPPAPGPFGQPPMSFCFVLLHLPAG